MKIEFRKNEFWKLNFENNFEIRILYFEWRGLVIATYLNSV